MKTLTMTAAAMAAATMTAAAATLDVTGEATYTDANIAELNGYDAVNLATAASTLTIDIASDATISCLVTNQGSVVKKGVGVLSLSNNSSYNGFNVASGWRIEEGAVALPTEIVSGNRAYSLTKLYIAKDAQLRVCPVHDAWHAINFAGGEGVVTNMTNKGYPGINSSGTFAGTFGPFISYSVSYQPFTFTGVNYMSGNGSGVNGATFSVLRSDGLGSAYYFGFGDDNSWLKYIGEGGATFSQRFTVSKNYCGISGGDHGGLTVDPWSDNSGAGLNLGAYVKDFYLAGEGGTNVLQTTKNRGIVSGAAARIVKKGKGAWWFKHDRKTYQQSGATEVREGKLIIDALFDKGEVCALGIGTNAAKSVATPCAYSADVAVPYGVLLSGGELEFIGSTNAAFAADRGIGVSADSKLTDNGQNVIFGFAGVQSVGETPRTLTLGGTNALSRLDDVKDGADGGTLSLEKVGSGTWTLGGDQTFSGTLDVKEGTVRVLNDGDKTKFTYFRIHLKECGLTRFNMSSGGVIVNHFGLFDADGNRLGRSVNDAATFGNGNLQTNEVGWARDTEFYNHVNGGPDGGTPKIMFCEHPYFEYRKGMTYSYNDQFPSLKDPKTWQRLVVRLPDDVAEVASYDIITPKGSATGSGSSVCSWSVDGSVDGIYWTELDAQEYPDGVGNRTEGTNWVYDDTAFVAYNAQTKNVEATKHTGFPITATRAAKTYSQLANATVRVAPGAALVADGDVTLAKISVADGAKGMGAIRGFKFAESGVFAVENMPKSGATFAKAITDATDAMNLAKWTVSANGKANANYSLRVRADGTITIAPKGLMLIVR